MAGKKSLKVLMFSSPAFCRGGDWGLSSQHCSGIPGGRTRPERKGLSNGGVRGQPAQGLWFILPVGFACCDPGENVLEIVSDAARSHTKRASPTLGWVVVEEPGGRQPAWKGQCVLFALGSAGPLQPPTLGKAPLHKSSALAPPSCPSWLSAWPLVWICPWALQRGLCKTTAPTGVVGTVLGIHGTLMHS